MIHITPPGNFVLETFGGVVHFSHMLWGFIGGKHVILRNMCV